MAIGGVSAAVIWRFVYAANPPTQNQIGLLNGIVTGFGGEPVNWLQISDFRFNSLLLMVMFLWLQAGFAMVLLSAAIKGVPTETLEAARLDGAGEGAIFFRIVIPQIRTTLITVFITVLIGVLKTFDVVYVMTNGNFNTNVIAVDFFNQLFTNRNGGYAAAIVVMLLIIMIPSWCSRSVSFAPRRPPDERNAGGHRHSGPGPETACLGGHPDQAQGSARQVAAVGADRPRADLRRVGGADAGARHHVLPPPGRGGNVRLVDRLRRRSTSRMLSPRPGGGTT